MSPAVIGRPILAVIPTFQNSTDSLIRPPPNVRLLALWFSDENLIAVTKAKIR